MYGNLRVKKRGGRRAKSRLFALPENYQRMTTESRRLPILTVQEVDDLYRLPHFTEDERHSIFQKRPYPDTGAAIRVRASPTVSPICSMHSLNGWVPSTRLLNPIRCGFTAPGGTLLVVSRGRKPTDSPGAMPWPLIREDLDAFGDAGLKNGSCEDYFDNEAALFAGSGLSI
jgi:hypothetical protein